MKTEISLTSICAEEYALELANFLAETNHEKEEIITKIEAKSPWNGGSAFDCATGGIVLEDYEWFLCCNPYKEVFTKRENDAFTAICPLENSVLLRGPKTYYYLVSFKIKKQPLQKAQVIEWQNNIIELIDSVESVSAAGSCPKSFVCKENVVLSKLLLGIMDNFRHFVIHCLTAIILLQNNKNFCIDTNNSGIIEIKCCLNQIHSLMDKVLFADQVSQIDETISTISKNVRLIVQSTFYKVLEQAECDLGYYFKLHREADNYFENYIATEAFSSKIKADNPNSRKAIRVFSIMSGAIELGILLEKSIENAVSLAVGFRGDYLFRHASQLECCLEMTLNSEVSDYIIDDNIMTGGTIVRAAEVIKQELCSPVHINKILLLRHPCINRIPQMCSYGRAVAVPFLRNSCYGLLYKSPYSRIALGSNGGGEYLDCFGVFTLTGEVFLRYLFKNGLYGERSEVYYYNKYSAEIGDKQNAFLL